MTDDPLGMQAGIDASMAHADRNEIRGLERLAEGGAENLKDAAKKFEALLLNFLMKQMWKSVERSGLLPESPGRNIQEGMLTTMLSDYIAEQGGLGIADSLAGQLEAAAKAYGQQQADLAGAGDEVDTQSSPVKEVNSTENKRDITH
jgi:Rod binding domain-containing protein